MLKNFVHLELCPSKEIVESGAAGSANVWYKTRKNLLPISNWRSYISNHINQVMNRSYTNKHGEMYKPILIQFISNKKFILANTQSVTLILS